MRVRFDCRLGFASGFQLDANFETSEAITAIVGPSGSGKTTILHCIAGLLRPASGQIAVGERVLVDTSRAIDIRTSRRRVGMVFQDHRLFPHLSVAKNILYGHDANEVTVPVDAIIQVLELEALQDRHPVTLSGGQQQRVALARALASNPDLLLLDEPVLSVEERLREQIIELLRRIEAEFRIPMLLVSHEQRWVDALANRVISLSHGRIVSED